MNWKDTPAGIRKQILDMFHVTEEEIAALDEEGGYGEAHHQAEEERQAYHRNMEITGALLSEEVIQAIYENNVKPLSIGFGIRREYPPLTRRQKFRVRLSGLRWSIHDRLFPECRDDDR